jgi:predicted amidohydrolase
MKIYMRAIHNYILVSIVSIFFAVITSSFHTNNEIRYSINTHEDEAIQKSIRIAGVKSLVTNDIYVNVEGLKKAIDYAENEKADILLTPEGSLSGYKSDFDQMELSKALEEIVNYASSAKVGLALGTCFYEGDNKCYNQIRFYDKKGKFLGFHSKILRCGNLDDPGKGEINEFASTPLRTFLFEDIIVGGLICNDMWANPECTTLPDTHLSQQLSRMGARIIFHSVNGSRDESEWSAVVNWNFHESNLRLKASAGNVWIVTADNSYPEHLKSSCPSGVLSPGGDWVCRTEEKGVQYFSYTIEMK